MSKKRAKIQGTRHIKQQEGVSGRGEAFRVLDCALQAFWFEFFCICVDFRVLKKQRSFFAEMQHITSQTPIKHRQNEIFANEYCENSV